MLGTMGTLPSSGPTPAPGGVSAPNVPQFEPVSPDDGDQTPPLINMEGACILYPHPPPSHAVLAATEHLFGVQ